MGTSVSSFLPRKSAAIASGEPNSSETENNERPLHVLIAGAGPVGLTIAQGCRENGIPYTLFERDESKTSRSQGWALTLHWCLDALEKTMGPELAKRLPDAVVDPTLTQDKGNFLFLNAATCETRYKIPPSKRRLRLHRQKLRDVLESGLTIQSGKALESFETLPQGGIEAKFRDGTTATGTLLVGADGNNSAVRKALLPPEKSALTTLPVKLVGVVRDLTPEQAAPIRALDPLLFQALHPETQKYLWFSIQECSEGSPSSPEERSYKALVIISWFVHDAIADAIPASHAERIQVMKKGAEGFAEPLRSIVMDIPDDLDFTTPLTLADFPCEGIEWDNLGGRATMAGDAAHAMTMYRGEGANHGILDAALLVNQLKLIKAGTVTQEQGITAYEDEMKKRTGKAVLLSRQAALDAHDWNRVNDSSPIVGARMAPESALGFAE